MNARPGRVLELEHRVEAPPDTVFTYFTDPERHVGWVGISAQLDPRPGGIYRVQMDRDVAILGEYVEVDPPRRIVYTWGWETTRPLPYGAEEVRAGSTTVEIELVPDGAGTIIHLRHSGFRRDEDVTSHAMGWEYALGRMLAYSQGETPGPYPDEFLG